MTHAKREESSVNSFMFEEILSVKSFIYTKNKIGPRTDPCGTPASTPVQSEFIPFKTRHCFLSLTYDFKKVINITIRKITYRLYQYNHQKDHIHIISNIIIRKITHGLYQYDHQKDHIGFTSIYSSERSHTDYVNILIRKIAHGLYQYNYQKD